MVIGRAVDVNKVRQAMLIGVGISMCGHIYYVCTIYLCVLCTIVIVRFAPFCVQLILVEY